MPALTALLDSGRKPLWLDYGDYAGGLLAGGRVPWLDVAACVGWLRKAQGLLKSDVIGLPLASVIEAWLAANPALREEMAAKRRAVYAIKTLLADEPLRAQLLELARGLRACFADTPLALVCPSPRRWVREAFQQAHGAEADVEVGDDEADTAAMYMADFLRSFADAGIDGLLLQESADHEPATAAAVVVYQPVLNIAAHYRWEVGLEAPAGRYGGGEAGLSFVIAPSALAGARAGLIVPDAFWSGEAAPACPAGGLRHARIPVDAQPERVLQRLAELRA